MAVLMEIVQLHCMRGLRPTYAALVDFSETFALVPDAVLMVEVDAAGVRDEMAAIVRRLHASSRMEVARLAGATLQPSPSQRGVRQGEPLFPLPIDLYIDDVLDGVVSVALPGLFCAARGLTSSPIIS